MLFENLGGGQFKDISQASGLNHNGHSSAAVFFDYNRDGLLDVYLTNVGKYTSDKVLTVTMEQARGEKEAEYKFFSGFADAFSGHLPEKNEVREASCSRIWVTIDSKTFRRKSSCKTKVGPAMPVPLI